MKYGCRDTIASGIIRSIGREAVESKELVEIACRLEMAERMERDSNKRQAERTATRQASAFVPSSSAAYNSGTRLQLVRGNCFICGDNSHQCPVAPALLPIHLRRALLQLLPREQMQPNHDHFKNGRHHYVVVHVGPLVIQVTIVQEIDQPILLQ